MVTASWNSCLLCLLGSSPVQEMIVVLFEHTIVSIVVVSCSKCGLEASVATCVVYLGR